MNETKRVQQASGLSISVQQSNAPYLSVTMRMFSTRPNRNGDGVTERFIDSIIENAPGHVGLPLYADTKRLRQKDYANLDHQYDPYSGEFLTEEIGSFCGFEKAEDEYGVSQFGEARVYKRSKAICSALMELYSRQMLNVSFEIAYDTLLVVDGVEYIDASANNVITGMAIVSRPAYPEAFATRMVAEDSGGVDPPDEQEMATDDDPPPGQDGMPEAQDPQEQIQEEGVFQMTLEEAMAKISQLETDVGNLTKQQEEKPVSPTDAQEVGPTVPQVEYDAAIAGKDTEITALRQQVEALNTVKAELDTLKQAQADADRTRKQEEMKSFASANGLDVEAEAVAAAIDALDYEVLIAAAMENKDPAQKTASARPMSDIAVTDPYGGILSKTNQ